MAIYAPIDQQHISLSTLCCISPEPPPSGSRREDKSRDSNSPYLSGWLDGWLDGWLAGVLNGRMDGSSYLF